jgi:acyl phosphate:glycerol-3-phosphate acyltransferase
MLTSLLLLAGYALGSIPFAYIVARRLRGIDLRRTGSGNVGAANVLRTTGIAAGVAAVLLDGTKGALAVALARRLATGDVVPAAAGVAAVVGHAFSMWLGFRGGKGVATACGAFSVLAPAAAIPAAIFFAVTVWLTRYVSLGSLIASVSLAPMAYAIDYSPAVVVAAALSAALIIERHRSNLSRLLAGTERRVGQKA